MKFKCIILLFLLVSNTFAQVDKIKVKKNEKPALYKVSIAGADTGAVSLKKILIEQRLKVTNEKDGIKIFNYEAFIIDENKLTGQMFNGKNNTLTDELLEKLQESCKLGPTTLRFKRVLAYNSFNEPIQLNDIEVRVLK